MLMSPQAAEVDRQIMAAPPPKASGPERAEGSRQSAPSVVPDAEAYYRHFVAFGPEEVIETTQQHLSTDELMRLAGRMNQVIGLASRPRKEGEPRDVSSYRARISEAKSRGAQATYLKRVEVKGMAKVDPRVELALELHADGLKKTIIATRVGRSVEWVRKTVRGQVSNAAVSA